MGSVIRGKFGEASRLLMEMVQKGFEPEAQTYTVPIVKLCEWGRIEEASRIIGPSLLCGFSRAGNLEVAIGLYNYMVKCDVAPLLLPIFDCMEAHGCLRDSRTYNEIMTGLCSRGSVQEAMLLFGDMVRAGPYPTVTTYNVLINGYILQNNLEYAERLFGLMKYSGCDPDEYTYTEMIDGFCKSGKLELAYSLFHEITERGLHPNELTFTSLIDGHCKTGNLDVALELLGKMKEYGCSPTAETFNAIINGFVKENRFAEAEIMSSSMSEYGLVPNVITYTTLIDGLCQHGGTNLAFKCAHTWLCQEGKVDGAESLFEEMQKKGIVPNVVTFTSLINGFVMIDRLDHAFLLLHKMLESNCQPNYRTFNVLLKGLHKECNMLVNDVAAQNDGSYSLPSDAKVIGIDIISQLLIRLSDIDGEPTTRTYSTLITGFCRRGKFYEVEQLVKTMQEKDVPLDNDIYDSLGEIELPLTTYGLLISTLCKLNQVDEAVLLFKSVLEKKWNSDEVVWSVFIDGLLREGQLDPCVKLLEIIQYSEVTVTRYTCKLLAEELSKVDESFTRHLLTDKLTSIRDSLPG
ncbi:hypothetical protein RDABS01_022096 [Bienertia sinuspersici]